MNRNVPVPFLGEGQRQRWPLTRLRAVVPKGKKSGTYVGRIAVKTDGYFKITGKHGMVEGIHARYCSPLQRVDGYAYKKGGAALPPQA